MSDEKSKRPPLSERIFENNLVTLPWLAFVGAVFLVFGRPLARVLVVYWVKGVEASSRENIRIERSKHPLFFNDGSPVPELTYFLVNLVVFFVIVGGLSLLLIHSIRFYERRFQAPGATRP